MGLPHRYPWNPPIKHTYKVTRCTHSPTCHLPAPPERLPWESVPKQLTVRQVHEHGGTPMETGQDLTEQTSQRHQTHYQPKHTWLTGLCVHSSDLSRPHAITLTYRFWFISDIQYKYSWWSTGSSESMFSIFLINISCKSQLHHFSLLMDMHTISGLVALLLFRLFWSVWPCSHLAFKYV